MTNRDPRTCAITGITGAAMEVHQAVKELEKKHACAWLGEEGERIQEVLDGVDPDDEWACMDAWGEHLRRQLRCPFKATVDEFQERGPLQAGDRVTVRGIPLVDDLYGVIVRVTHRRRRSSTTSRPPASRPACY